MKTTKCRTSSDFLALTEDICIILKLTVGRKLLDFLYDPGSQFTMIPKHLYGRLAQEPALFPINKLRVGVAQQNFSLDRVVFINIVMGSVKDKNFQ